MKKLILILIALMIPAVSFADVFVSGYTRSNGTYVAPHYRSSPNSTTYDNWSTQGNVNPYTGQYGTRPAYPSAPSRSQYPSSTAVGGYDLGSGILGQYTY